MKISDIALGKKTKKSFFDHTHDVNTTSDFGFCQPTLVDTVIEDSDITFNPRTFVRMAPLVAPIFGRVKVLNVCRFVPMSEVFEAYDFMMSESAINARNSYVPTEADSVQSNALFQLLMSYIFSDSATNKYGRFGFVTYYKSSDDGITRLSNQGYTDKYGIRVIEVASSDFTAINNQFFQQLASSIRPSISVYKQAVAQYESIVSDTVLSGFDRTRFGYMSSMNPANADFVFCYGNYFACVHLTHAGKRLFKILNACGWAWTNTAFPLYPIFAYYKAWYDQYNPGRVSQWRDTNAYWLIHTFYDYGVRTVNAVVINSSAGGGTLSEYQDHVKQFFYELPACCYSLDVDPYTVCTEHYNEVPVSQVDYLADAQNSDSILTRTGTPPYADSGDVNNAVTIQYLMRFLRYVNKRNVLGNRVEKIMATLFNKKLPKNYLVGEVEKLIDTFDVMSNSDTFTLDSNDNAQGAFLGEYAGAGKGFVEKTFKYHTEEAGVLVNLLMIVPLGGYSQGLSPRLPVNELDFYHPEYDSLGNEAVPVEEIIGKQNVQLGQPLQRTFGFRPRYFNWKFSNNLINGGFSFRSERDQFMAYNLDRVFTPNQAIVWKNNGNYDMDYEDGVRPIANESLRFIGRDEGFGNYDRIFYDASGTSDNFIVQQVLDLKIHCAMLPVALSFDTYENEGHNNDNATVNVSHS